MRCLGARGRLIVKGSPRSSNRPSCSGPPHRPNRLPAIPRRVGGEARSAILFNFQRRLSAYARDQLSTWAGKAHCYLHLWRHPRFNEMTCIKIRIADYSGHSHTARHPAEAVSSNFSSSKRRRMSCSHVTLLMTDRGKRGRHVVVVNKTTIPFNSACTRLVARSKTAETGTLSYRAIAFKPNRPSSQHSFFYAVAYTRFRQSAKPNIPKLTALPVRRGVPETKPPSPRSSADGHVGRGGCASAYAAPGQDPRPSSKALMQETAEPVATRFLVVAEVAAMSGRCGQMHFARTQRPRRFVSSLAQRLGSRTTSDQLRNISRRQLACSRLSY